MTGRDDALDRVAQTLVAIALLVSLANGLFMLIRPLDWYQAVPGVSSTGPANGHFIRDIGIAYLSCGVLLLYAVLNLRGRWLAALAGALWLSAHGLLHVYEVAAGICSASRFWGDAPGVLGPPLLVLAALAILFARQRIAPAGLPRSIFVAAVERAANEKDNYVRDIGRAPGHALEKFMNFMPATLHRYEAPSGLFHAARIGSMLTEDCGECALAAGRAALSDGVGREDVNAILAGGNLAEDLSLAFRFGQSIALHTSEANEIGDAVEARFGRVVRLELAMTAAMVRGFPGTRRGLGMVQSCAVTKLSV